jgi:hypothetical protein
MDIDTTVPLYIGRYFPDSIEANGVMSFLGMAKTNLTADNIADIYNREAYDGKGFPRYLMNTNDVLSYRLNERGTNAFGVWTFSDPTFTPSPGKAQDWRGTAHMTPANMAAATVNGTNGVAVFNGSSSYLNYDVANYNSSATSGAVNAWVNLSSNVASCIFSSSDKDNSTRFINFRLINGKPSILQNNAGTEDSITAGSFAFGSWKMITYVSDGIDYFIYVNGVVQPLTVVSGGNTGDWFADVSAQDNIHIGAIRFASTRYNFANGSIDEPLILNYVPTSNQVHQLYIETKGMFGL